MKILIPKVLILGLILNACESRTIEEYYIPCGYTGWINVIYNHPGPSRLIKCENKNIFLLSGDLTNCYINASPKAGEFTTSYFKFCDTDIIHLKSPIRYKTFVPFRYQTTITIKGKTHNVDAFYISGHPMDTALPDDSLPKNPLVN